MKKLWVVFASVRGSDEEHYIGHYDERPDEEAVYKGASKFFNDSAEDLCERLEREDWSYTIYRAREKKTE